MAADTRVSVGDVCFPGTKIFRIGEAVVGIAGEGIAMMKFMYWAMAGFQAEALPEVSKDDGEFSALVLNKDGLFAYDDSFWPEKIRRDFHAIGSGGAAALAAMMLGQSAANAVGIACQIDLNSGPPIDTLKLVETKRRRK